MSVHQRHCRKNHTHADAEKSITEPSNKSSRPSSNQVQHHVTTAAAGKLFRHKHLPADERTADIPKIKPKLKLPPANEEATWKDVDREISSAFETFKNLNDAGKQLERREDFIYRYLEERFGTVPEQQNRKNVGNKDRNMEKLRKRKNDLKKELKKALKRQADEEDLFKLRQEFSSIMRLHNKVRKLREKKERRKDQEKANKSFRKDPYGYSKRLLEPNKQQKISFSKSDAENYFSDIYKDSERERNFNPPESTDRPQAPSTTILTSPPKWGEIQSILRKTRNKSAPGPNGVPYIVYKKCPRTFSHIFKLMVKIWNSRQIPAQWRMDFFHVVGLLS